MTNAQKLLEEGERLLNEFDFEGAYKKFTKAIKAQETPEAFFGRAEAALGMPEVDADNIIKDYEKAIEMQDDPFYRQSVASFCVEMGKFEKAENHYRKAAELDPENRANYLSEFAVGYRYKAPIMMQQYLADGGEDIILRKAMGYMLEAMNIDREKARELLN